MNDLIEDEIQMTLFFLRAHPEADLEAVLRWLVAQIVKLTVEARS